VRRGYREGAARPARQVREKLQEVSGFKLKGLNPNSKVQGSRFKKNPVNPVNPVKKTFLFGAAVP